MSVRSFGSITTKNANTTDNPAITSFGDNTDGRLVDKVNHLEEILNKFRAEVDIKMQIVQQVLSTRNEQLLIEKELVERLIPGIQREQALHESILSHWSNVPYLVENGLELAFSDNCCDVDVNVTINESNNDEMNSFKRKSSSEARRERKKRLKTVYKEDPGSDSGNNASGNEETTGSRGDLDTTQEFDNGGTLTKSAGDRKSESLPAFKGDRNVSVSKKLGATSVRPWYQRFVCLEGPNVTRTPLSLTLAFLRENKLGQETIHSHACASSDEIEAIIRETYPSLGNFKFELLRGITGGQGKPLITLSTSEAIPCAKELKTLRLSAVYIRPSVDLLKKTE